LVTYVTDGIESAMEQAKAAAGDRDVQVRGAYTAQRALEAGVLDEEQIHQIPSCSVAAGGCSTSCRPSSSCRSSG
jgi:dihydrofolate reductase